MANPTPGGVVLDPPEPPGGYVPGTVVLATFRYSDPDSRPAIPGREETYTFEIRDASTGAPATATTTIRVAPVPAQSDIVADSARATGPDGKAVERVSATVDAAVFRIRL